MPIAQNCFRLLAQSLSKENDHLLQLAAQQQIIVDKLTQKLVDVGQAQFISEIGIKGASRKAQPPVNAFATAPIIWNGSESDVLQVKIGNKTCSAIILSQDAIDQYNHRLDHRLIVCKYNNELFETRQDYEIDIDDYKIKQSTQVTEATLAQLRAGISAIRASGEEISAHLDLRRKQYQIIKQDDARKLKLLLEKAGLRKQEPLVAECLEHLQRVSAKESAAVGSEDIPIDTTLYDDLMEGCKSQMVSFECGGGREKSETEDINGSVSGRSDRRARRIKGKLMRILTRQLRQVAKKVSIDSTRISNPISLHELQVCRKDCYAHNTEEHRQTSQEMEPVTS